MNSHERQLLGLIEEAIAANRLILPSLPEVALRVRELTADEQCSTSQLVTEIARDAAIAARLIKVANSSAMRTGQPVTALSQAVTRLGLNLVRSLVTQLSILQVMQTGYDRERLHRFVQNGLRSSAVCHALASKLPHLDPEQASLAGLLHDIGKLPLLQYVHSRTDLANDPVRCEQIEQSLHPAVGGVLLRHWGFSDELVQVAQEHETLDRDPSPVADYTDVVISAHLLHYGTNSGRYSEFDGRRIPALEKTTNGMEKEQLGHSARQRMSLSLNML